MRVLVVDDEPGVARVLERLLTAHGFEVHTCNCAISALDYLESHGVDAVVSDFSMPGANGVTLLSEVKRRWPTALRVLISALAETLDAETLAPCQPCRLLSKPFRDDALLSALRGAG
jgi:DNA-binding NtrC family response regulator